MQYCNVKKIHSCSPELNSRRNIKGFVPLITDNLDLVSQRLVQLAKDNGSSDNITIIVLFLRPVEELVERYDSQYKAWVDEDSVTTANEDTAAVNKELYSGVTSTSVFVGEHAGNVMNGERRNALNLLESAA